MIDALIVTIVVLGLPGLFPALIAVRRSPVVIFLAPLVGALMAAVAAECELGIGGSLLMWYVPIAVTVNAVALLWLAFRKEPSQTRAALPWQWFILTAIVVIGAVMVPLSGLRAPMIGYDANVIWLSHTLLVSGGHRALLSGLQNPVLWTTNPSYPALIPASGALSLAVFGRGDLLLAVRVTALLNACAVGVVAVGVATVGNRGRPLTRLVALLAAGALCVVCFAVAGDYAVNGFADLLWSVAALGAVVWGLVLPTSKQALVVAWVGAMVASLTKNEGFITALLLLVLISLRHRPPTLAWLRRPTEDPDGQLRETVDRWGSVRGWTERALFVVVPALPGLVWVGLVHHFGLVNYFFGTPAVPRSSLGVRASATIGAMAGQLAVLPVALAVLVAGSVALRRHRENLGLGNPLWLWASCLSALGTIFAAYLFGALSIHSWLQSSVDRTTIFPQVALLTDLAIWLIVVFGGAYTTPTSPEGYDTPTATNVVKVGDLVPRTC